MNLTRMRSPRRRRRRGQALFIAIIFIALVLALSLTLSQVASNNNARVAGNRHGELLLNAARAGLAQSRLQMWEAYLQANGGKAGNGDSFKAYLAGLGLDAGETNTLAAMTLDPGALGGLMTQVTVTRTVQRQDQDASVFLVLSAVARDAQGETRRAEEVLRMGGQPFEGFRFALLANNVNCIFCHASFDNVTRYYGEKDGTHQRIKVAAFESIMLRDGPASTIAGTLYSQGALMTKSGTILSVPPGGSGKLQAKDIDSSGKIIDPTSLVNFVEATKDGSGNYNEQFANFYKNYPTDPALQIDGAMPEKFPPVVADENANRMVDDSEWTGKATTMKGTLSGGVIQTVAKGSTYAGTTVPSTGNASTYSSNTADTHVMLVGTKDNPIVIDGDVAIDGDVVISGYVKGTGLLLARGNMYILDDVVYADGADGEGKRTFGVAQDGTPNTMAFAAGGNIIHGPYNTSKSDTLLTETSGGFTVNEMSLFNRMEWTKTQPYFDPNTGRPTSTNTGVANSAYVDGYVPRYYTLSGSATEAVMFTPEGDVSWDNTNKVWVGKEHGDSYTKIPLSGTPGTDYVLRPLNPAGDWISQANLKAIYDSKDAARPAGPYEIDGLLYTDNAIMMLARKAEKGGGQAIVNGAIVSADAGILVPGPGGAAAKDTYDTWSEGSARSGSYMFDEADFGVDVNGDGDLTDSVSMADIYANRATWPANKADKWDGNIVLSSGKYKLDINQDGDYGDKVTMPKAPPANDPNVGLQLNYDVNTKKYLVIEDPTSIQLFTVGRREG